MLYAIKAKAAETLPFRWYAFGSFVDSYMLAEPLLYDEAQHIAVRLIDIGYVEVTIEEYYF